MAQEFTPQYTFKEDRLNELKQLFPEAWEDGVFNVDTLKELIGEFSTDNTVKEHFGLNWVGKQDARRIAAKPPTGTLKPCIGEGVNEDTTENIFIEGENLEVLKILRKSYMGKIKMIYIDPPYNTGNDFVYNDTFADSTEDYLRKVGEKSDEGLLVSNPKSSGRYHANWLSFMYPRLRLAKDLLKDDGVIFISIDDNEVDNLRLMCDEIFGRENFITEIVWQRTFATKNDAKYFSTEHEYILMYAKSIIDFNINQLERGEKQNSRYKNPDNDPRGLWTSTDLLRMEHRANSVYAITSPTGKKWIPEEGTSWRHPETEMLEMIRNNEVTFGKDGNSKPRRKRFLKDVKQGVVPQTIWKHSEVGHTQEAKQNLNKLFGGQRTFDTPKPIRLIERMIKIASNDEDFILDFFAGTASLAHAVLDSNVKNNYNRKFICVQLPEKTSENSDAFKSGFKKISEISKDRIKRAINQVDKNQGVKFFRQNNSTIYKWQEFVPEQDGALPDLFSKMELAYKNPLQDGVTTQDFITEVILHEGFPLTAQQEEVASGIFKITHEWVPYTLYATMLYSFKNTDFETLPLVETDHFVCLDKAFDGNDALKQSLDNTCKLYTI